MSIAVVSFVGGAVPLGANTMSANNRAKTVPGLLERKLRASTAP
jgi:hypothetical protein